MEECLCLPFNCLHDLGVAVAQAVDPQSAQEIQVAFAVRVVDITALTSHQGQISLPVSVEEIFCRQFLDGRVGH